MIFLSSCDWLRSFNWFKKKDAGTETTYAKYVDPFIGTGGHGHTFPGACVPFGMMQLSPDTRIDGSWDGCGGYHYSDKVIYGFSHTHLSGTGCSDYGDILLMPTTGEPDLDNKHYSSTFSHSNEKASAGYYSVKLDKSNILVELTATTRAGMHKYTFPNNGTGNIVIDLMHRDKTLESRLNVLDKTHVEGMRRSEAWAKDQHIYFSLEFSKPFKASPLFLAETKEGESTTGKDHGAVFTFDTKAGEPILVRIGISTVSMEGARKNLQAEINTWDFEEVKANASKAWNDELGKIEVKSTDKDKLKVFYTALYHTMIQPNVNMDVDSMYRGRDNKIHKAGYTHYSVFSLWDTFRGAHPLYTIIEQKRTNDFIQTFLSQYKEGGRLPVWELASNETDCMIGYHSVAVIADAAVKGINHFDMPLALEAMQKSATRDAEGLTPYRDHGYLALEDESESVSKTLEYAYDDWCISLMAGLLNKKDDEAAYLLRSQNYRNVFDPSTGFMRPRTNGCWLEPFEPREVNNNFTEANSWQYSFFVPQDFNGLIQMLGGKEKFGTKLDSLFAANDHTTGREQADITGLIGQYAHGNEPSHHIAYLYNFAGQPWKTQEKIHRILTEFYKASPDGLIGNEDCGQMSAWYVLSAMGFYSVSPGAPFYAIGSPLFPEVKIHLENGNTFVLRAKNASDQNFYIQSAKAKFNPFDPFVLPHKDLMRGDTIEFVMGPEPGKPALLKSDCNPFTALVRNSGFVTAPAFASGSALFRKEAHIAIAPPDSDAFITYTIDGKDPDAHSSVYSDPFTIEETTTVKACAFSKSNPALHSGITKGVFHKFPNDWTISITSHCNPQYSAGGEEALIDGIFGDANWRKGYWQGYQGQDFEAVIDMGKKGNIKQISARFLQDEKAWIMMPKEVDFYISADGKKYTQIANIGNTLPDIDEKSQVREFKEAKNMKNVRYVKVRAVNYGKLPEWHQGAGGDAYIFIDEITITPESKK
jgi:predicted alpha-1,2-mannosidase